MWTIGGLFFIALSIFALVRAALALRQIWRSAQWPKVKGEVIMSWVDEDHDFDEERSFYRANVNYSYEVDGIRYESDNVRFGKVRFGANRWGDAAAVAYTEAYPAGREVLVYFNPSNPAESVLERRINNADVVKYISGSVVCLALGIASIAVLA